LFNIFAAPSILRAIFSICSMCHAMVMITQINLGLGYKYYKECNRKLKAIIIRKYGSDNPNKNVFY
jgi:hypothetical protein